jgi:hypothetical protein
MGVGEMDAVELLLLFGRGAATGGRAATREPGCHRRGACRAAEFGGTAAAADAAVRVPPAGAAPAVCRCVVSAGELARVASKSLVSKSASDRSSLSCCTTDSSSGGSAGEVEPTEAAALAAAAAGTPAEAAGVEPLGAGGRAPRAAKWCAREVILGEFCAPQKKARSERAGGQRLWAPALVRSHVTAMQVWLLLVLSVPALSLVSRWRAAAQERNRLWSCAGGLPPSAAVCRPNPASQPASRTAVHAGTHSARPPLLPRHCGAPHSPAPPRLCPFPSFCLTPWSLDQGPH